uniref:ASCH domain-containing protein n=1 Tax=Oryza meridionalis TaxID=40149 RepID=A0A0E0DNL3_9ORYZ
MLTGKSQRTLRCPHSTKMASSETPPPPSPSPGTGGAVPLAPALVGLLRFVLSSHLASPDPALPLFPSYCSRLLLDDDDDDQLEKLAAGLARCVEEGRLPVAAAAAAAGIPAGEAGSEEREREWEAVVLEKGNELKRLEPKKLKGGWQLVITTEGSLLLFNKCLLLNVQAVRKYASFSEMLQAEMISEVLPGVGVYRKFYTEEKESLYGVLAISVSKPTAQPYITMTELLASLGSDGLGRLLGMVKTADVRKNQLASEIIDRLLRECCWMNIHLTQPYGPVYEIRVHEGYGARWSQDGSKFIGFLEPYSPEGFSKGWKH